MKQQGAGDVAVTPWPDAAGFVAGFGGRFPVAGESRFVTVKQVHGSRVVNADALTPGFHETVEADALTASRDGTVVAVRTADCVPILLVAPESRWAAAVHAGWRGTVAAVAKCAIRSAREAGVGASAIHAAIGPAIGPCCYEVGEEVAERFASAAFDVERRGESTFLDLPSFNRIQLLGAGVPSGNIRMCSVCTRCNAERFYSVRANAAETGRQLSWIGFTNP